MTCEGLIENASMFEFRHSRDNIWELHALSPPSVAQYALGHVEHPCIKEHPPPI